MTTLAPLQHFHPPLPYRLHRRLPPAEFSPSSLWAHPQLFPVQDENRQKQFSQQLGKHQVSRTSKWCFNALLCVHSHCGSYTINFLFKAIKVFLSSFSLFIYSAKVVVSACMNSSPPASSWCPRLEVHCLLSLLTVWSPGLTEACPTPNTHRKISNAIEVNLIQNSVTLSFCSR